MSIKNWQAIQESLEDSKKLTLEARVWDQAVLHSTQWNFIALL